VLLLGDGVEKGKQQRDHEQSSRYGTDQKLQGQDGGGGLSVAAGRLFVRCLIACDDAESERGGRKRRISRDTCDAKQVGGKRESGGYTELLNHHKEAIKDALSSLHTDQDTPMIARVWYLSRLELVQLDDVREHAPGNQ
jgi:hypothetical protein